MTPRTPYDHNWRAIRLQILERDCHVCQVNGPKCKVKANHVDHIIPLAEGGERLDPSNLRAACGPCNTARGNTRSAELAKALERPEPSGTPSRQW